MQQETLGKASSAMVFKFSKEYLLLSSAPSTCCRSPLLSFHVFPPAPPFRVSLSLLCPFHTLPGAVNTDELVLSLLCVDLSSVTSSVSLGALYFFELLQTAVIPGLSLPQNSPPSCLPSSLLLTMLGMEPRPCSCLCKHSTMNNTSRSLSFRAYSFPCCLLSLLQSAPFSS